MRRLFLFGSTSLTALAIGATHAVADITGSDVWAAYVDYYEATGAQVIGAPVTTGAETVVADPALLYRFPFGVATVRIGLPTATFTDQSDGSVAVAYPETFDVSLQVDVPDQGSGSGVFLVSQSNFTSTATGEPDAITVSFAADEVKLEVKDVSVTDIEVDVQGQVLSEGYSGTSTITVGEDLVTVTGNSVNQPTDAAFVITLPTGDLITETGEYGVASYNTEMALPKGGNSLFTLSKALQDGAFFSVSSKTDGSISNSQTTIDGQVISEDMTITGPATSDFRVDADGILVAADVGESSFKALMPDFLPIPIEGAVKAVQARYAVPLLPRDEPQSIEFQMGIQDLTITEDLWAMVDPAAEMPRDPASLNIDIVGSVISGIDWLDFANLEAQLDQPVPPITLEEITINDLSANAVGASVEGNGAFTVDLTDMETFDGFPRPEGEAYLAVSGANALIDRLSNMGVIGSEEAGMARLGLGFIARATGDDAFETAVEVNPEGQVFVNGQRMR
ncbi:MAG: hypothetical protein AAFP98_02670 [Pseudomonadota bacterium]